MQLPDAWLLTTRDFCGLESLLKSINDMVDGLSCLGADPFHFH